MTTKTISSKTRQRRSQQYKTESLALAEKVGIPATAKQLGLHESQLYSWRSKARLSQDRNAVEERLLAENARLKRQLAEQTDDLYGMRFADIVRGHGNRVYLAYDDDESELATMKNIGSFYTFQKPVIGYQSQLVF